MTNDLATGKIRPGSDGRLRFSQETSDKIAPDLLLYVRPIARAVINLEQAMISMSEEMDIQRSRVNRLLSKLNQGIRQVVTFLRRPDVSEDLKDEAEHLVETSAELSKEASALKEQSPEDTAGPGF